MRNRPGLVALIALVVLIAAAGILIGNHIYRERGVLVDVHGNGPGGETTEVFTADGDWDLRWSYDCSTGVGNDYRKLDACDFAVTVKQYSDCQVSLEDPGVRRHGGPDHGVVHFHTGGTFYFVVESDGNWTITVTGPGRASGLGPAPRCTEG